MIARAFERRVAERSIRASILHWLAALGTSQTVAVSLPGLGRGGTEPHTALCNNADRSQGQPHPAIHFLSCGAILGVISSSAAGDIRAALWWIS